MTTLAQLVQDVRDESHLCADTATKNHQALYRAARALVRESLVIFATSNRPAISTPIARRVLSDCAYMMQYDDDANDDAIMFAVLYNEIPAASINLVALFDAICLHDAGAKIRIPLNWRGNFQVKSIRDALDIAYNERNF